MQQKSLSDNPIFIYPFINSNAFLAIFVANYKVYILDCQLYQLLFRAGRKLKIANLKYDKVKEMNRENRKFYIWRVRSGHKAPLRPKR